MMQENWQVVYTTYGAFEAEIIVGRLQAEKIPARFWTESAGRALGITVGKLGTSYIEVPETFIAEAEAIINLDFSEENEAFANEAYEENYSEDEDDEEDAPGGQTL